MNSKYDHLQILKNVSAPASKTTTSWQRIKNWAAGKTGHQKFHFPVFPILPHECQAIMLQCRGNPNRMIINGQRIVPETLDRGRYILPPSPFQRWENTLSLSAEATTVTLFPLVPENYVPNVDHLPTGTIWRLEKFSGQYTDYTNRSTQGQLQSRLTGLAAALAAFVIMDGPQHGDVWSFYDLQDHSFRLSAWRWDTGIVLEALAAAAIYLHDNELLTAACRIGDRLLAMQTSAAGCPGGIPEWVDFRYSESKEIISEWVAPFNAGFIAAGLVRLYQAANNHLYLVGAHNCLKNALFQGMTTTGGLRGYYFCKSGNWRYLGQINDSGILPRGIAAYMDAVETNGWASHSDRYMAYIVKKAACSDGYFGRAWHDPHGAAPCGEPLFPEWKKYPDRLVPKVFMRGQAWVLYGLTGAFRTTGNTMFLERARRLVDFILQTQLPEGMWLYSQFQPDLGPCVKGTAALSFALGEYVQHTGDIRPMDAIARGLDSLDSTRLGTDLFGLSAAPVERTKEGCIIYFRNRPVICAYTSALEILARIQFATLSLPQEIP